MHERKPVLRKGPPLAEIKPFKALDGTYTFIAVLLEDDPANGKSKGGDATEPPSYSECAAACPVGYELYRDGGMWRARPGH